MFNLVRLPGNERSRDFSDCGNPCFNIGGRDGHFLETVMDRAAVAGVADKLRVRLTLKTETRTNLKAENAVAVVPGKSDEVIILDAHVDAWFDGAGDNADGLAVPSRSRGISPSRRTVPSGRSSSWPAPAITAPG